MTRIHLSPVDIFDKLYVTADYIQYFIYKNMIFVY